MKNLWAPWRMQYIESKKPQGCALCVPETAAPEADREKLVLWRGERLFAMLNRYPYAAGHIMVIPYRHVGDLGELDAAEMQEMLPAIQLCCEVLRTASQAEGLNVGLNLGQAAGAGIRGHLHFHVVPRWQGDSQFIAVMDDVRVIPQYLDQTWEQLRPHFARHEKSNRNQND